MGGSTLTIVAKNKTRALAKIKDQIQRAVRMNLYPDSALVVIEYGAERAELYQVNVAPLGTAVSFTEIEKGPCFHVGVAANFGPKLGPGQWLATVHVHS